MAKKITQDTFDSVVHENLDEFEMEINEAITDAIQQFTAQEVDLSNIVKDAALYATETGDAPLHPVIVAITNLKNVLPSNDTPAITALLMIITEQCDIDLAHRSLAASNQAWSQCLAACQSCTDGDDQSNVSRLAASLNALCALCNGQPDIVTADGREYFISLLRSNHTTNADMCARIVRLVRLTCIMHEANRQAYAELGLIPLVVNLLDQHCSTSAAVVTETCGTLRILATDDDMRATFGKAHEHAKIIVAEQGALAKIINVCKVHNGDEKVIAEMFATLSRLAVRNEFCQQIHDLGGLAIMIDALQNHTSHQVLMKQAMIVLKSLAGNDEVKRAIVTSGAIEYIVEGMTRHARHVGIAEGGCAALATFALRVPENCERIVAAGGSEAVVKAMQIHVDIAAVQKKGCMALRNIVSRSPELKDGILVLGAESVINTTFSTHQECHDEAKAALRDLGCDVTLIEQWKGKGHGISR